MNFLCIILLSFYLICIVLTKKKNKNKPIHNFDMYIDYESLDNSNLILKKNKKKIKNALNNTKEILSQLLLVNNPKNKISIVTNASNVCKQKIPYFNEDINNGIKADFILYPFITKKQQRYINQGVCLTNTKTLRPIIGYLKIKRRFNYSSVTEDELTTIFLHHITHILGFNVKKMSKFTTKKKLKSSIRFDNEDSDIKFKGSNEINEIFLNKNYDYIDLETRYNELHWSNDIPFPDYMKENEKNNLITPYSLSLFDNLGYFIVQLPYLIYDSKTLSYNVRSYSIYNNALVEVGQCYGEPFKLYIKKGNKCKNSKREIENTMTLLKFPELKDYDKQTITFISPSPICKNKQKTVYFEYLPVVGVIQKPEYPLSKITFTSKEFMILSLENFSKMKAKTPKVIKYNLLNTKIISVRNQYEANLHWVNSAYSKNHPPYLVHYNKYNHLMKHGQITRKDLLYSNYYIMRKKYPNDYNYMGETYKPSKESEIIKKKFYNYTPTEDNLWLIKPVGSARGNGIKFLKSYSDITKGNIITRYISNPHLIDGRKYDCRIYLLVTGFRPLKAYIYYEGLARRASDPYNINIKNLDNFFIHLTNVAVNKNNKNFKENDDEDPEKMSIWSLTILREQLEKEGKDFNKVFKKIHDIAIKSLISMYDIEIETEDKTNYNINSQNLFELYGMDILIDQNMKPWLLEINLSPSLASIGKYEERLKYRLFADIFNIIGLKSYSHYDYEPYEDSPDYENKIDEDINESICEFTRPMGGFIRVFPRKDNIDYYKQFFNDPGVENLKMWEKIKQLDI